MQKNQSSFEQLTIQNFKIWIDFFLHIYERICNLDLRDFSSDALLPRGFNSNMNSSEYLGIFFPTMKIEACDSFYLQKAIGNGDILLVVIIDLLLLKIIIKKPKFIVECHSFLQTHGNGSKL